MILYHNGTILTLDNNNRVGSCLLVDVGKITGVFDSVDECGKKENLELVDLQGKTVIPGFNDNHIHLNFLGDSLESLHFTDKNEDEIVALLLKRFGSVKKGVVIEGQDWDYPACSDPHKEILDKAFPDNPVILSQYGGHTLWVNSVTLKKMKIDSGTPDPDEGIICRDKNREPTGILKDIHNNSFIYRWFVGKLINYKKIQANYLAAFRECARYGITSLQDNTWSFVAMMVIGKLYRKGMLGARLSCWSNGESGLFRPLFNIQRFNSHWFQRGPAKFFLDGTFSGRNAWVKDPYPGTEGNCGQGKSKENILKFLEKEIRKKQTCAFHAIGDRAISEFLDALEELAEKYAYIPSLRIRLEHAQLISPEDFQRIKDLGVLISAQPSALCNPEKDITILGKNRTDKAYPYRSLLDKGIPLSFGSDAPGENTLNPFENIHFAVNRTGPEKISVLEALKCYTSGSAYAEFREKEKGTLSPGMTADFIVLSENPMNIEQNKIKDIIVEQTYLNGVQIYPSNG
ncbi:MAG: amidohydrolase [Spirochaetaceae bacterium]|nr:amidohydrolase [Spirochaetaceae bacterium]